MPTASAIRVLCDFPVGGPPLSTTSSISVIEDQDWGRDGIGRELWISSATGVARASPGNLPGVGGEAMFGGGPGNGGFAGSREQ